MGRQDRRASEPALWLHPEQVCTGACGWGRGRPWKSASSYRLLVGYTSSSLTRLHRMFLFDSLEVFGSLHHMQDGFCIIAVTLGCFSKLALLSQCCMK